MAYNRKIAYFDLTNQGQKKGNGGFCKWEQKNGSQILTVLVNGLPKTISEEVDIHSESGKVLGSLRISQGRGENICYLQEGSNWEEEISHVRIPLPNDLELIAEFQNIPAGKTLVKLQEPEQRIEPQIELPIEPQPRTEEKVPSSWEGFWRTREKIHPFGTEEEYCRIAPEDVYRLKEEYHVLRNNQFLLHGYYNYHYLILGKKQGQEYEYWLGVPGIYHEREKMAARMYGFEKFEGAKPGYTTGDLGYYLITAKPESMKE